MGFFGKRFGGGGGKEPVPDPSYEHPDLGEMHMDTDSSWNIDDASVPFAGDPISVSLEGGPEGPDQGALDGYEWLSKNFTEVQKVVQDTLFEMYDAYKDHHKSDIVCGTPADLWGTENLMSVSVRDKGDFDLSMTFKWQDPRDDHIITAYVEDGKSAGHTVDG